MNANQQQITALLTGLANAQGEQLVPATEDKQALFTRRAVEHGVDQEVIQQLVDLYHVANAFTFEIIMAFHACDDETLFEWWDTHELWLGQRDFYTLRWANGKFCLGDASNVSFSEDHEFNTLIELIQGCIKEIRESNYFDN